MENLGIPPTQPDHPPTHKAAPSSVISPASSIHDPLPVSVLHDSSSSWVAAMTMASTM
ncbi:MAG: hypothetical protein R3E76_07455 [Planctomycetota bacterium]